VPFTPFRAQFGLLDMVKIPWPGPGYPTVFTGCCGRRFGKTTCAEILCWHAFTAPEDMFGPPVVRITADTFEHGEKIWDRFIWHAENTPLKALIKDHNRSRRLITGHRGETIQLLSADNPSALAGDGVTTWVVDEAQYLSYPAYENLFPSTAERNGIIVMFGVAEGDGPFRELCYKGAQTDYYPEYANVDLPTSANPYVPRWRIDLARRVYTPDRFKQLYLGQWADATGKIFRNVEGCVDHSLSIRAHPKGWAEAVRYSPGMEYYGGLDLAIHSDWCVYTLLDRYGRLVAWDRFNRTSWELLKYRVQELSRAYGNPVTYVDSTGSGDPIYEDLLRMGMAVIGYQISGNLRKHQLIDGLAVRIGAGEVSYPEVRLLIEELSRFEAVKSRTPGSTVIQYQAPAGFHDDFVVSLALAVYGMPRVLSPVDTEALARLEPGDTELREMLEDGYVFAPGQLALPGSESEYFDSTASYARPRSEADYL